MLMPGLLLAGVTNRTTANRTTPFQPSFPCFVQLHMLLHEPTSQTVRLCTCPIFSLRERHQIVLGAGAANEDGVAVAVEEGARPARVGAAAVSIEPPPPRHFYFTPLRGQVMTV